MWTYSEGKSVPKVWGCEFLWVGEFHRIASGKNILAILRKGRGVSGAGSWHIFCLSWSALELSQCLSWCEGNDF